MGFGSFMLYLGQVDGMGLYPLNCDYYESTCSAKKDHFLKKGKLGPPCENIQFKLSARGAKNVENGPKCTCLNELYPGLTIPPARPCRT